LSESIRAVERALDVLECFSIKTPELSMTQIAEKVGMNKSTVHRLLATLERKRFVERNPVTGTYRAGIHLLQLAYLAMETNDLRRVCEPFLRQLWEQHRETIDLAVFDGNQVIFISVIESPQRVRLAAAVGQRLPAFCTASGKAILSYMPENVVLHVLEHDLQKYTDFTLVEPDQILSDLRMCKEQGFAITEQEFEDGINAVGAAIFGRNKLPIATVSVAGPSFRLTHAKMMEIGPSVRETADAISGEIGNLVNSPV
jgi:IclR family KDG regulon transcriptional repressor